MYDFWLIFRQPLNDVSLIIGNALEFDERMIPMIISCHCPTREQIIRCPPFLTVTEGFERVSE